jgi:predicted enzyme related to lactoylglutathione lyase
MAAVTGFGGAFLRAQDPEALARWYEEHLGLARTGASFVLPPARGPVALAFFARDDPYLPPEQPAMIDLRVDDLDAVLDALQAAGVAVDPRRDSSDFGRFGGFTDPEGNRVELWQEPTA